MGALRTERKPTNPVEILEEMRISPDKSNRFEAVMARGEVYTNGERAECHGVMLPRK